MGFPYIVELENIDNNQKYQHLIYSSSFSDVFNKQNQINYETIVEFILMYQPQCDRDMLLIMYQQQQTWKFMTSQFFKDLKNLQEIQESADKVRQSKFGSRINAINTSSHIQSLTATTSTKQGQKTKIILSIRFQCQGWADQPEINYEGSINSQKDQATINLSEKIIQTKAQIKQMQKISNQLHMLEAQSLGINIFWASPYYSKDGIMRKPPKGTTKIYQQQKNKISKQFLKNSANCMPYINAATHEILQSNKKIILNIEQFNSFSFARRNIFKVVYLICHTQTVQIKTKQITTKFRKNINNNSGLQSSASQSSLKNQNLDNLQNMKQDIRKSKKKKKIQKTIMQQTQQDQIGQLGFSYNSKCKLKKTTSEQYFEFPVGDLNSIPEQIQEDKLTQRKPSQDTTYRQEFLDINFNNENFINIDEDSSLNVDNLRLNQKQKSKQEKNQLSDAFGLNQSQNLLQIYSHQQYQYQKKKLQKKKLPKRSNSKKSNSSYRNSQDKRKSRSKKKNIQELQPRKSITSLDKQGNDKQSNQYNAKLPQIKRNKKKDKNSKKFYKQQQQKKSQNNPQNNQKQVLTYFIGQSKTGQLQKITPQDLDDMLSEKKLQNIQLLILHTSFPYSHLPIFQKHANNIIVINSNPIFPEACTVYFIKVFFKYLLQTKNIQLAFNKASEQTKKNYESQNFLNVSLNLSRINSITGQKNDKDKFDPFMQAINKKYIRGGPYTCCCYHWHEPWCNFKSNKSTSKYADDHFKFHVNRCNCHYLNIMEHSCKDKQQNLGMISVIDKKNYKSNVVYDCCCLGYKQGRYSLIRKNTIYNQIIDQQIDDPHSFSHKYQLIKQNQEQKIKKQQKSASKNKQQEKIKQNFSLSLGEVQGNSDQDFISSMKYLTQNQLIGNSQIIVNLLQFFAGQNSNNQYFKYQNQQFKADSKISSQSMISFNQKNNKKANKTSNSILRQSIIPISQSSQNSSRIYDIYNNQSKICNLYGQNSSGRKTISKYLANLMVVKNLYSKWIIKYFSKFQELKTLQTQQKNPNFYILVYSPKNKISQINLNPRVLSQDLIPPFLNAIIISNKRINFDKTIKHIHQTPIPFNKQQIQTYIKKYEHLSNSQKLRLKTLIESTDTNQEKKEINNSSIKIYANKIDPYQVISLLRKLNYQNKKHEKYLESLSRIHIQSFSQYIVIAGIIYQTFHHGNQFMKRQQIRKLVSLRQRLQNFLCSFMSQGKSFYLLFSSKTKIKGKNKQIKNEKQTTTQPKIQSVQQLKNQQKSSNKKIQLLEKQLKQQIITIRSIQSFYPLIYPKFQKQISLRSLQPLKIFIYYTTLNQKKLFSLKNNQYFKIKQKNHLKSLFAEIKNFNNKNISYEEQFYQASSLNKNSFITAVLNKQINLYATYLDKKQNSTEIRLQEANSPVRKPSENNPFSKSNDWNNLRNSVKNTTQTHYNSLIGVAKRVNQQSHQNQKKSLNSFFIEYVSSLNQSPQKFDISFKPKYQYYSHQQPKIRECGKPVSHHDHQQTSESKQMSIKSQQQHIDHIISPDKLKSRNQSMYNQKHSSTDNMSPCPLSKKQSRKIDSIIKRKNSCSNESKKSQNIFYEQNFQHLDHIIQAGLFYMRNIICSHFIYDLLEGQFNQTVQVLKASIILINNAIILMKMPDFKSKDTNEDLVQSQQISDGEYDDILKHGNEFINQNVKHNAKNQTKSTQLINMQNIQTDKKLQSSEFSIKQSSKQNQNQIKLNLNDSLKNNHSFKGQHSFSLSKKNVSNQKKDLYEFTKLFSIKGLLYLLFKVKQRCDKLILRYPNQRQQKLSMITNLSVITQLLTVQLHLINIFKGQTYQQISIQINSSQKHKKYFHKIFYDRFRSINSLKQLASYSNIRGQIQDILYIHILSAYFMLTTNGGRKKINQTLCDQINRIKVDLDSNYKSVRKDSISNINLMKEQEIQIKYHKIVFLQKISQDKDIFLKILSLIPNFKTQYEKNMALKKQQSQKKKNTQNQTPSYQKQIKASQDSQKQITLQQQSFSPKIKLKLYKTQIEIYLTLLDINYQFQIQINTLNSCQLYSNLYQLYKILKEKKMIISLKFCARYINEFHQDIYNKITNYLTLLRQKFILFLTADPIESSRSIVTKKCMTQNCQDLSNKKVIDYQANHKTFLLSNYINDLNSKFIKNYKQNQPRLTQSKIFRMQSEFLQRTVTQTQFRTDNKFNQSKINSKDSNEPNKNHSYFVLQKKLNQQNLIQLSQSFGCKFICIDTTMCASNKKDLIIGQNQQGQIHIFENNHLAQLIQKISANVLFICLPRQKNLSQCFKNLRTRKQIVYFNFDKNNIMNKSQKGKMKTQNQRQRQQQIKYNKYISDEILYTYYRMIMQKITSLIIQKIVQNQSEQSRSFKLKQAFNYVANHYEFIIKNCQSQTMFYLTNEQLKRSIFCNSFELFEQQEQIIFNDNQQNLSIVRNQCSQFIKEVLFDDNIVSSEEVQDVKSALKHKYKHAATTQTKSSIKIQNIQTFQKFFRILQTYLKDKQNYEEFYLIDIQNFKYPMKQRSSNLILLQKKSQQTPSFSRQISRQTTESQKRRKQKKHKQLIYEQVKYGDKWKSQFIKYILQQNLINFFLSKKKGLIMFTNSQLLNSQRNDKEEWTKKIFQNLFSIKHYDQSQKLKRLVHIVKVTLIKQGDKKNSPQATIFFMQNCA